MSAFLQKSLAAANVNVRGNGSGFYALKSEKTAKISRSTCIIVLKSLVIVLLMLIIVKNGLLATRNCFIFNILTRNKEMAIKNVINRYFLSQPR